MPYTCPNCGSEDIDLEGAEGDGIGVCANCKVAVDTKASDSPEEQAVSVEDQPLEAHVDGALDYDPATGESDPAALEHLDEQDRFLGTGREPSDQGAVAEAAGDAPAGVVGGEPPEGAENAGGPTHWDEQREAEG